MEYAVPLIIVLVIVIAVVVGSWLVGRRNRRMGAPSKNASATAGTSATAAKKTATNNSTAKSRTAKAARLGREISRENAEEASARLTAETHQRVYSLIAQRQVLSAVKEYRKATGLGLGDSAAAVAALAQFPQPSPEPQAQVDKEAPLTVADIINASPEAATSAPSASSEVAGFETEPKPVAVPNTYRYRAIVSQGDDIREVASTRLNEEIFSLIRDLALAGDYDGAARLLRDHADIGETEAGEFVRLIQPEY